MKLISSKQTNLLFAFVFISLYSFTAVKKSVKLNNFPSIENPAYPKTLSATDKLLGLGKIWSEAKYNFVNIDRISFDIDSLYKETIQKVLKTTNDEQYFNAIELFLAAFNDGHTELYNRPYRWKLFNDYIPALIQEINRRFYFTSIRIGISSLDSTALGAEILEIEGIPAKEYVIKNYFPSISASTEQHRWMQAGIKMMQGEKGTKMNGKARKINGEIFSFSIIRNGESTRSPNDKSYGYIKNRNDWVDLSWQDSIAILEITSFDQEEKTIQKINIAAELINSKAKGLIIDLRRNGGGSSVVANHLLKFIVKSNYFLNFGSQRRVNDSYGRAQGNYRDEYKDFYLGKAYRTDKSDTVYVESTIKKFHCPIIILIGNYTFSAAEDFLVNLYEIPNRPVFMGEYTGGSTGAPLCFNIVNNSMVRICSLRITYPYSGKPFIGEGIKPDIILFPEISGLIKGEDLVLETALTKLKKTIE